MTAKTAYHANEFELHALADDGNPHHDHEPAGWQSLDFVPPADSVPVAVLGGLFREIAPGLLKQEGAPVVVWTVEDCSGFTLLLLCVDKR